jgi:hypothetical protein
VYSGNDPSGIGPPDKTVQSFSVTDRDDCSLILQNSGHPDQKSKLILNPDGTCTISVLYMFNIAVKQNAKGSIQDGVIIFPNVLLRGGIIFTLDPF